MEPIHEAAHDGNLVEVDRLLEEDGSLLNARDADDGLTPLMWAVSEGHDAVVARLLALGADVEVEDQGGWSATHWTCRYMHCSTLALLLDAGAHINQGDGDGFTPLTVATSHGALDCVSLLVAHSGIDLDAVATESNAAAIHLAALRNSHQILTMLVQAGADPTIQTTIGRTPLNVARWKNAVDCIPLLEAAMAEPQRPRLLLKARALLDAAHKIRTMQASTYEDDDDAAVGMRTRGQKKRKLLVATPAYLKGRVEQGQELPRVSVVDGDEQGSEELVACVKYALGLAHGGGVHFEGEEQPVGMLHEVFVELCEMLVPKWDRKNV